MQSSTVKIGEMRTENIFCCYLSFDCHEEGPPSMGITLKDLVLATLLRNIVTFTVFVRLMQPCFLYLFISCNSDVLTCMLLAGPVFLKTS